MDGICLFHKRYTQQFTEGLGKFRYLVMMAGNLTNDQRKWILKQYWKTENAEKVRQKWAEEFDTPSPSRQTIYRIRDKFDKTGSICNAPKSGRPVSITTQENEMLVSQAFTESPKKSKQRASVELGISCRSLSRIMQRLGLKMYRPRLLHGLLEDDPDRRLQFCEVVLNEERQGNSIIDKIIWSNEAHFKLSGAVYRHNCVYFSRENSHIMIEGQLNEPGITVWAGFSCKGVFGPIFFHTAITQDLYLNMLKDTVLPQLQRQHDNDDYFFQQDEAHPHCAVTVREFLDEQLPNRWIGRRGPVEWPPRSPDLTPMDFFFWGVVKDKVFLRKPRTVDDMICCIREVCQEIDDNKELCAKVCSNIASRLQECVNNEGRQFEQSQDCT
ncbi:uncharacterized protein LOC119063554 isoform X1 [Artibeus jamaicensis]|uniref:uncharacterized protein LOC119063554 isoform X1 n=2 Tax=Artibeus jamaicensis TaxID=9417 RepID=UPI00235AF30A|nr:uncharacterized protein LOC119063554 isoform X1 [Artibeus jamaicensis]